MYDMILHYFDYADLPMNQKEVGKAYYQFAHHLSGQISGSAEKTVALRKLLESRDCALRAINLPMRDATTDG